MFFFICTAHLHPECLLMPCVSSVCLACWIDRQTHGQTDRQADKQTNRDWLSQIAIPYISMLCRFLGPMCSFSLCLVTSTPYAQARWLGPSYHSPTPLYPSPEAPFWSWSSPASLPSYSVPGPVTSLPGPAPITYPLTPPPFSLCPDVCPTRNQRCVWPSG